MLTSKWNTLYQQQIGSNLNEIMAYVLRPGVTVQIRFVAEIRKHNPLQLFYDIIQGCTVDKLKELVVRAVDVHDKPLHWHCRVRQVMVPDRPLKHLQDHTTQCPYLCQASRLFAESEGRMGISGLDQHVDESIVIRFEPVPPDQMVMRHGEDLITVVGKKFP
jgi:hypothetical protein